MSAAFTVCLLYFSLCCRSMDIRNPVNTAEVRCTRSEEQVHLLRKDDDELMFLGSDLKLTCQLRDLTRTAWIGCWTTAYRHATRCDQTVVQICQGGKLQSH